MNSGIPALENAYDVFFYIVIFILAIMAILFFIRAVAGPRLADRVVAVNMIGTIIIVIIAILSVMIEGYLVDICLIYAMVSFLAVIVLTKIYTGVYKKAHKDELSAEELEGVEEEDD